MPVQLLPAGEHDPAGGAAAGGGGRCGLPFVPVFRHGERFAEIAVGAVPFYFTFCGTGGRFRDLVFDLVTARGIQLQGDAQRHAGVGSGDAAVLGQVGIGGKLGLYRRKGDRRSENGAGVGRFNFTAAVHVAHRLALLPGIFGGNRLGDVGVPALLTGLGARAGLHLRGLGGHRRAVGAGLGLFAAANSAGLKMVAAAVGRIHGGGGITAGLGERFAAGFARGGMVSFAVKGPRAGRMLAGGFAFRFFGLFRRIFRCGRGILGGGNGPGRGLVAHGRVLLRGIGLSRGGEGRAGKNQRGAKQKKQGTE